MSLRVAAYCRVSTAQDDQLHSLAHQQAYFRAYIMRQPDWELVGVFADEGLSGTVSRNRPAFQEMLQAAREGKIDLILTKEVSRFARNTVDTLAHTRALRQRGVGVLFINDNIDTRQDDGEFRLAIMASVAQEESRKTSERVKWGQKRSMEQGVVFGCDNIYGFSLKGGRLTVKPEEAAVVRRIYHKFLREGKGTHVIGRELYEEGIDPPRAGGKPWSSAMVLRILRNEKYCGDLLQKKSYTPSYLDHKKAVNRGAEPPVYLRGHHEAIVPRAVFEQAQRELARRAAARGTRHSGRYWCSGKLLCAACGARLVPKKRALRCGDYRDWVCAARAAHGARHTDARGNPAGCDTPVLPDEILCACVEAAVRTLPLDWEGLAGQAVARLEGHGPDAREGERLRAQKERTLQKLDGLTDAFLEQQITREEYERLRARYRGACAGLERQMAALAAPEPDTAAWRDFLRRDARAREAVWGQIVEQVQVAPGRLCLRLHGLPAPLLVAYQQSGKRPHLCAGDIKIGPQPETAAAQEGGIFRN